jgi:hypothetical protein
MTAILTQSVPLASFTRHALIFPFCMKSKFYPRLLIRAKRVLFWTKPMRAAAEPRPDDPDNRGDDEIQVTRVPGGPKVGNLRL